MLLAALLVALGASAVVSTPAQAAIEGPYRITITGYNLCLDVRGVSQSNGALLQVYTCLPNQYNQQFYMYTGVGNRVEIRAVHSNKCLDVQGVSYSPGAAIQQYTCLGPTQTNQQFFRTSLPYNSERTFIAEHSQLCINRTGLWDTADVVQGYCNLDGPSVWRVIPA